MEEPTMEEPTKKEMAAAARRAAEEVLDTKNSYSWSRSESCACGFLLRELFPEEDLWASWHLLSQSQEISAKACNNSKRFRGRTRERGAEVLLEIAEEVEKGLEKEETLW